MTKIRYITHAGEEFEIEGADGHSVMEIAVRNDVPGIAADCGGALTCATCQVYVDDEWQEKIAPPDEVEEAMLEFAHEPLPSSRLACQIKLSGALDGLVIRVPKRQY